MLDSGEALEDVPAEVLTGPGREFVQSGKTQGEIAARINCGWFPGLPQGWRIVGRAYLQHRRMGNSTAPRGANTAQCTAGVNDGQT